MSFLSDLLKRCHEHELEKLKEAELPELQRQVLCGTIESGRKKGHKDKAIMEQCKLSKSHYDKINSILLDKTLELLTNGSLEKRLSFLNERELIKLMRHELKITERQLSAAGDKDKLRHFHWVAFQQMRRGSATNYNDELTRYHRDNYLQLYTAGDEDHKAEIMLQYEYGKIFVHAANTDSKEYEQAFKKSMKEWEEKLRNKPYYAALVQYHLCWASYYDFYTEDYPSLIQSLRDLLETYDKADSKVGLNYKIYALTKLAKAYCMGSRFEEALKLYREIFAKHGDQLQRNYYHPLMFSVIAIINHKFEEAQQMMDAHLKHVTDETGDTGILFDIERTYAILYMHKGDFKKAADYLQMGQTYSRLQVSFLGEVLQRMVHNAFFVMNNDLEGAKANLNRNFKYLDSKPGEKVVETYRPFFEQLKNIIRHREGRKLPADFDEKMVPLRKGIMKMYGDLLDKMMD